MARKYVKCECPDEEIYLCEDDGFYDLYIKSPFYERNTYINSKPIKTEVSYEEAKDKLPKPFWSGHEDNIKAYDYSWKVGFSHIKHPTKENGFVRSFIDTSFNGNTFMGDSSSMMSFTKYASHIIDLAGTLENFYCKQHIDGFICREIREDNGKDRFHRHDPITTGPHWLAFAEWELFKYNGNKERIAKIFDPLMGYHLWLKKFRTNPDGSYWCTGLSSTMDNQPRVRPGKSKRLDSDHESWNDTNIMMILDDDALIGMAKVLGREDEVKELKEERDFLLKYILKNQWDKKTKFFYNSYSDGSLNDIKTIGAFWSFFIDDLKPKYVNELMKHLLNKNEFNRFDPFPSISADSRGYDPNGNYWCGGIWSCMVVMVLKGLIRQGKYDVAFDFAYRHNDAVVKSFIRDNTLWEVYAPDSLDRSIPSENEFVGWTGCSTISVLLEFVFGILPHPVQNKIEWHINLLDDFGVENYYFNGKYISLKCKERKNKNDKPEVEIIGENVEVTIYYGDNQSFVIKK